MINDLRLLWTSPRYTLRGGSPRPFTPTVAKLPLQCGIGRMHREMESLHGTKLSLVQREPRALVKVTRGHHVAAVGEQTLQIRDQRNDRDWGIYADRPNGETKTCGLPPCSSDSYATYVDHMYILLRAIAPASPSISRATNSTTTTTSAVIVTPQQL